MTQAFRVAGGACLDRARPISFTFDGVAYGGYEGDTLASALLANGVRLFGRSYKYHRPRGVLSAGAEEPNALVGLSRGEGRFTPNLRATQVELYDGLVAASQNRWPSLKFDVGEVNDLIAPLIGAGFYYKTFMGPDLFGRNWAWRRLYEPAIRRAAGLGNPPSGGDPDRYVRHYDHCDVLIVGAGPAGLAAALAAGLSGARVVLCDENAALGGSLIAETRARIEGEAARGWLSQTLAALAAMSNVRLMPRTQAFGYYAQNFVGLSERLPEPELIADPDLPRERLWQMRAREVVLAAGAIERPLVFADNDRPGVMLADAARRYLNLYGVKVGDRIVVVTAHDGAYRAALDLKDAGVSIKLVADLREAAPGPWPKLTRAAGIQVAVKAAIHEARGRLKLEALRLSADPGGMRWIEADALLMSGGWTPSAHLFSQSRGKLVFDEALQAFKPGESVQRLRAAGACNGSFPLSEALAEGDAAGRAAAEAAGFRAPDRRSFAVEQAPPAAGGTLGAPLHILGDRRAKAFVDYQNDVSIKDLTLAIQEGMRSIEHIKRYTTTGMATDQGKLANMNALAIAAAVQKKPIAEVGFTTFRPPYTPVTFGAFAGPARGELFDPVR
ncbi:MAG: (2Fe-2S)-binding protein, partial [Hyphomicrobiales bacterium]|nr:(2Fe-2S)-binding protein [Hyphomicrobiales bacterium]